MGIPHVYFLEWHSVQKANEERFALICKKLCNYSLRAQTIGSH